VPDPIEQRSQPPIGQGAVVLPDGHRVSITFCGRGLPFVFVHGAFVSSAHYAGLLRGLATLGFRAVGVDAAGHGKSSTLRGTQSVEEYGRLLGRTLDELGIRRAFVCGHSAGARIAAELTVGRPEWTIALVLVSPSLGAPWDSRIDLFRRLPPALAVFGSMLIAEGMLAVPAPGLAPSLLEPWRAAGLGMSILNAPPSSAVLERLRETGVPVVVVHGDRDSLVPLEAAADAAERAGGELVVVPGGTHYWLLNNADGVQAVLGRLLAGGLSRARDAALAGAGLDAVAAPEEVEAAFYEPGAATLTYAGG
jgi:pimeloyl-ACP methyl ester carboxylesterase